MSKDERLQIVLFHVHEIRHAVPMDRVVDVLLRVRIVPLPGLSPPLAGFIDYHGAPLPVVDLRARLSHPLQPPSIMDHFLVVEAARRRVALIVDRVQGPATLDLTDVRPVPESVRHVGGLAATPDGLLLLADLDEILSLEEDRALDAALRLHREGPNAADRGEIGVRD